MTSPSPTPHIDTADRPPTPEEPRWRRARQSLAPQTLRQMRTRAAKRRKQELGHRVRRFEASLPGLRLDGMRPALPSFSLVDAFSFSGFAWSKLFSRGAADRCRRLHCLDADERWYIYPEQVR